MFVATSIQKQTTSYLVASLKQIKEYLKYEKLTCITHILFKIKLRKANTRVLVLYMT